MIAAVGDPATAATKKATATIPIVMVAGRDRVASGFVRMMQRRSLVVGMAALMAAPRVVTAQGPEKSWRIAWLAEGPDPGVPNVSERAFIDGLRDLGYVENKHFTMTRRFAGGSRERLRELADELAQLRPDLIAAPGTQALLALKAVTTTIPIVMIYPGDPVGAGIVNNLNRPGGNITGTSLMFPEASAKRVELLKEVLPRLHRLVVLWNPNNASTASDLRSSEHAARLLGVQLERVPVEVPAQLDDALNKTLRARPDGVLVLQDTLVLNRRKDIADFAMRYRLPTVFAGRAYVESGGLLGYGPDITAVGKRAAAYVDKIFKGAKPGDLPIEQPTKFDLIINLKTARTLGVTIPPSVLLRADQVIE